jgi:hypothetical protein
MKKRLPSLACGKHLFRLVDTRLHIEKPTVEEAVLVHTQFTIQYNLCGYACRPKCPVSQIIDGSLIQMSRRRQWVSYWCSVLFWIHLYTHPQALDVDVSVQVCAMHACGSLVRLALARESLMWWVVLSFKFRVCTYKCSCSMYLFGLEPTLSSVDPSGFHADATLSKNSYI